MSADVLEGWPKKIERAIGITRLADITGLDVIGLPVVQAVRPFSLSNAVSQGKGPTIEAAALSAVFESVESFAAEKLEHYDKTFASAQELGSSAHIFEHLLLESVRVDWHKRRLPWVTARNLMDGCEDLVPLELVHTAYVMPMASGDGVFAGSTTGLSAGFQAEGAVLHGLLECVERDAIARANRIHGFFQRYRIDPRSINDPDVCYLLEMLAGRGFLVGLWHAPSTSGVPVVWCHLMEACEPRMALMPFPGEGTAARLNAGAAICHAIYEAAQSRLTAISGARDDFTRRHYPKYPDWQMLQAHQRLISDGPVRIDFEAVENGVPTDLPQLLSRLEGSGHNNVYEVRLDNEALPNGVFVRKMIVPSMLPLVES